MFKIQSEILGNFQEVNCPPGNALSRFSARHHYFNILEVYMKNTLSPLLLILILFSAAPSQNILPVDQQIVNRVFNGEFFVADSLLEARIKADPTQPKYYALKAHAVFYTRYFDNTGMNRDSLVQLVLDYAQKALDVSEDLDETTETKLYRGIALGYKSRINAIRRDYWDAYWEARKSYNILEDVFQENPEFYDALLGPAVIDYFTATQLTGWRRSLAWLLGMSGDRDRALEHFDIVAEKGTLFKPEAKFINAMMYRYIETDFDRATPYFENFLALYPDNEFMQNQFRSLRLNRLIQEKGVEYLASHVDSLRDPYGITNANVLNAIGYNFINNEAYETAVSVFQINVKLYPDIANNYDSLGEGYMLLGNTQEAIRNYQIAFEKLDSDTTITEQFREFLRENIQDRLNQLTQS